MTYVITHSGTAMGRIHLSDGTSFDQTRNERLVVDRLTVVQNEAWKAGLLRINGLTYTQFMTPPKPPPAPVSKKKK